MALKVLYALDVARTQCYHFTAIFIAGMGFFTDAYDLFCIPPVSNLLGRLYYPNPSGEPGSLPPNVNSAVNGVALCGTFAGQLFFGWLGDRMGRKKVYGITLMLMFVSSIASGFSIGRTAKSVMTSLCFFRFWLGFGIGGDYPLSATIMSEYANKKTRGSFIAAVFAMQGLGIVAGSAVAIIVSAAFKSAYKIPSFVEEDFVWRIILMFGAVPAALTYYWRMKMPETARYTALVARDARRAAVDMSKVLHVSIQEDQETVAMIATQEMSFGLFSKEFAKRHGRELLGTTATWFFLDIAFYSSNLFQKDIFKAVGWLPPSKEMSALDEVFRIARAQALIAFCATLPGYLFTVVLIDRIGRFAIQLQGFFFMAVFMFSLAIPYKKFWRGEPCADEKFCHGHRNGFLAVYSLTFFFSNFGPNSTTFIVPAELFPARLRSTCHGISSAAGKAGAIIGAFGFLYAAQPKNKDAIDRDHGYPTGIGIDIALILLAITSCLGFAFTFLIPETNGRSLEENETEMVESQVIAA